MLPPEHRLPGLDVLLARKLYFVLHAPRQTGKTTAMQTLAKRLTEEGTYAALYFSCETARAFPEDVRTAERAIWAAITLAARYALPSELRPTALTEAVESSLLRTQLTEWSSTCPKPLVLIFDEIDAVEGSSLKSVLSQLRDGYLNRTTTPFPHSIILCGVRDVRDYKSSSGGDSQRLGSSSPFNIKTTSLRLGNFSEAEVRELYTQYTEESGQPFTDEAIATAYHLTQGQPWLVNSLAAQTVDALNIPLDEPITALHIQRARERVIRQRQTHLDSLVARLNEDRIRRILEPIIAGLLTEQATFNDDFSYAVDLGLINPSKPPVIANPIYREIILRVLADGAEASITVDRRTFVLPDGCLDLPGLLSGFVGFWRQHGEVLAKGMGYQEAAPHLVLMAWLHKIVNGGGFIEREIGIGTERIDLLVRWPYTDANGEPAMQSEAFEIKATRDRDKGKFSIEKSILQLDDYLNRLGLDTGVLAFFDDRTTAPPIHERTTLQKRTTPSGKTITLFTG